MYQNEPPGDDADDTLYPGQDLGAFLRDAWIGKRCATCDAPYGDAVDLPITVVDGIVVSVFCSDACAAEAGHRLAVRLRMLIEDYGIGRHVVVDREGRAVDGATFARYCRTPWDLEEDGFAGAMQRIEAIQRLGGEGVGAGVGKRGTAEGADGHEGREGVASAYRAVAAGSQ